MTQFTSPGIEVLALDNMKIRKKIIAYEKLFSGINGISIVVDRFDLFIDAVDVIVCTYPETAYYQALSSGKPTVALFSFDAYKLDNEEDIIIEEAVRNNLIICSPDQLRTFLAANLDNLAYWYSDDSVKSARLRLLGRYASYWEEGPLNTWKNWLEYHD
jgi:hypothetical protein